MTVLAESVPLTCAVDGVEGVAVWQVTQVAKLLTAPGVSFHESSWLFPEISKPSVVACRPEAGMFAPLPM